MAQLGLLGLGQFSLLSLAQSALAWSGLLGLTQSAQIGSAWLSFLSEGSIWLSVSVV